MILNRVLCGLLLCFWVCSGVQAQGQMPAGPSQIRRADIGPWFYVAQPEFYVYYVGGRLPAEMAMKFGMQALRDFGKLFDYRPVEPIRLHLYADPLQFADGQAIVDYELGGRPIQPFDFQTLNTHGVFSNYCGATPINQQAIYFSGTFVDLNHQVRTAVLRSMLLSMFLSQDQRGTVYNRLNMYLPEWFLSGLSRYKGEGWTLRDEGIMRSLTPEMITRLIDDNTGDPIAQAVQKSFWHYLEIENSPKKVAEVVYMMRLTRSVESGFRAVFGYSLESTVVKWQNFCASEYFIPDGIDPRQEANYIPIEKAGETLLSAAANPRLAVVAGLVEKNQKLKVVLYDRKKDERTVIHGPTEATRNPAIERLNLPMAWSADGRTLVCCLPHNNRRFLLYYYDVRTGKGSSVWLTGIAEWITHIEWSPDGKQLLVSASRNGYSDILLINVRNNTSKPLTRDMFDDLNPTWQPDGKAIYFQSNRDTVLAAAEVRPGYEFATHDFDIYRIDAPFENVDSVRRVTRTPDINETAPQFQYSNLQYLTDARGLADISRHIDSLTPPALMTQYRTGVANWQRAGRRSLFLGYEFGMPRAFLADSLDDGRSYSLLLTPQAERERKARIEAEKQRQIELQKRLEAEKAAAEFDSTLRSIETADSTQWEENVSHKKPVRFYVFDEEETPKEEQTRRQRTNTSLQARRRRAEQAQADSAPTPIDSLKVVLGGSQKYSLNQQAFRNAAFFDPLFGLGLQMEVAAEDPFRDHRLTGGFRLFNDLSSYDMWARYQILKGRTPIEFGFQRQQRLFEEPNFYRFISWNPQFSISYRIDPWSRISFDNDIFFFERRDVNLIDRGQLDMDSKATSWLGGVQYVNDQTKFRDAFPIGGWRLQLGARSHYSLSRGEQTFSQLNLESRVYVPLPFSFNLGVRLSGGTFIGPNTPKYMMGGWNNWMTREIDNREQLPIEDERVEQMHFTQFVTTMRGFNLNARNGTHFGLLNVELRYPLNLMRPTVLSTRSGYNVMWAVFMDLGTTWTEGNPFSQRNPIDVQRIDRPPFQITVRSLKSPFLVGFGSGIRMILVGYLLHADLAWGVEDGSFSSPRLAISFGKEF